MYESTSWYQLQQVISPGMGVVSTPVDYNYMGGFILRSGAKSGIAEPLRFYYSSNVMYQTRTWRGVRRALPVGHGQQHGPLGTECHTSQRQPSLALLLDLGEFGSAQKIRQCGTLSAFRGVTPST